MKGEPSVLSSSRGVAFPVTWNGVEAPEDDARECSRLKKKRKLGRIILHSPVAIALTLIFELHHRCGS
jgi:hypothetical protein